MTANHPVYIGGNEGLAEVTDIGNEVTTLKKGDWVVMTKQQAGTWATTRNIAVNDVLRVPKSQGDLKLSQVHGATISVRTGRAISPFNVVNARAGESPDSL